MNFSSVLDKYESGKEELEETELKLTQMQANYEQAKTIEMSGFVNNSNPWSEVPATSSNLEEQYQLRAQELEQKISKLKADISDLQVEDLESLRRIASLAARYSSAVSMCDDYAVVDLTTTFVIQKTKCGIRSVQGKLLKRLLQEPNGKFYNYHGDLVFVCHTGKDQNRSQSVVFLNSYLPSIGVDSSIITKGAVLEKYRINLKGMLPVVSAVSSKFDTMVFNMGASRLELSNDRGEQLIYRFEVEDAKTVELNKLLRGEQAGIIVMSSIEIPKVAQGLLPLLENKFTIYVKERKIILQSETLYVVFGR